jgi:hypothetical protein
MTKIVFVGTRVSDLSNTWGVAGNDIYSNYSGNVGIGTSTPTMLLDVSGDAKVSGNVTICGTLFVNDICGVNLGSGGGGSSQWTDGTGSEIYYQGNVGIGAGMTDPEYSLDVSGDIRANTIYADTIDTTSNITIDISNIDGLIQFGPEHTLVIDPTLNRVSIGKEGPERTLDVAGDVQVSGTLYVDEMSIGGQTVFDLSGTSDYIQMGSNNTIYADTANARVGIGKASPSVALDVSGNAVVSGNLTVDSTTLVVDASNNRVGIGLANPSVALDVNGVITAPNANIPIGFRMQSFTTTGSQTWTIPTDVYYLRITATAGGGGGGGAGGGNGWYAAGGGAGGSARWFGAVTPGMSLTITIGSGGAGNASASTGSSGTATTITATGISITCNGGNGGRGSSSTAPLGGLGGTSTGGSLNITGGDGCGAGSNSSSGGSTGAGGSSIWGSGGRGGGDVNIVGTNAGWNGRAYGTGGGGGRFDAAGGSGASGVVIIEY